jgi:hypothetical protein
MRRGRATRRQYIPIPLRNQAARCRRLASGCGDELVMTSLNGMTTEYEIKASALDLLALPASAAKA